MSEGSILFSLKHATQASSYLKMTITVTLEKTKPGLNINIGRSISVMEESILSGTFIDTKIYLYSRRAGPGRASCPTAFYANSVIFRDLECEELLLFRGCTTLGASVD